MGKVLKNRGSESEPHSTHALGAIEGAKTGPIYATLYSFVAVGLRAVGSGSAQREGVIPIVPSIAAYVAMGVLGGAMVGYWRASAVTPTTRALLCFALGAIVSIAAMVVLLGPPWQWDAVGWISMLGFATVVGGFLYARWVYFFES